MQNVDGHTKILAIIGDPVDHSFSPQMHNYISEKLNKNYLYCALPVKREGLKSAIEGVRALNFAGLNVTAPHKIEVMSYLDEISDEAKAYGSVNTVVNKNGRLYGYNTDAQGFYLSLVNSGIEIKDKDILLLGAGGACRPVCIKFLNEGAKSITVLNRTQKRAEELRDFVYEKTGKTININKENRHYDVAINTTSAGMGENRDCPISDFSFVDKDTDAADMIYNPSETVFLKNMKKAGARHAINGLGMLIYQGIVAYELFCGEKIDHSIFADIKREVFGF